jgi:flagellar biosynthesis protein FlhF
MNVKRFTARNSREALRLVREALGDDAIVLSTRPAATGVEVMAMASESLGRLEAEGPDTVPAVTQMATPRAAESAAAELAATTTAQDADRLSMSTLSFQDYVRKRMLKRRQASLDAKHAGAAVAAAPVPAPAAGPATKGTRLDVRLDDDDIFAPVPVTAGPEPIDIAARDVEPAPALADAPEAGLDVGAAVGRDGELLAELRAVKGLIEERFGALAFMEKLQRRPAEARLAQKLLDCGFSPMLVRKMTDGLPADAGDESSGRRRSSRRTCAPPRRTRRSRTAAACSR